MRRSLLCLFLLAAPALAQPSAAGPAPSGEQPPLSEPEPSSTSSQAPEDTPENLSLRSGFLYENLTRGNAPWTEAYLEALQKLGDRANVYAGARLTNRFGMADEEFHAGGYVPLGDDWTLNPYASWSPSHNILARWSAGATLNHSLGDGWGVEGGFEYRDYNATAVNIERLSVEKYFDDYRLAYTLFLAQGSNTGNTASHALTFSYYYDEHNSLNVALGIGRELQSIGPNSVRAFDVRSVNVYGTSSLDENAALEYGVGIESYQPAFTRRKLQLGFRYQF